MKRSTTWAIVGGLWGSAIGLVFGALPTFILVEIVDDLWSSADGSALSALLWGACALYLVTIGLVTGYLLGRDKPQFRCDHRERAPDGRG